jgi:hypothetical protein
MPTIYRTNNLRICLYAGDHGVPHFHALTPDEQAKIEIDSLNVVCGSLSKSALKKAMTWAEENKDLLNSKWKELNS